MSWIVDKIYYHQNVRPSQFTVKDGGGWKKPDSEVEVAWKGKPRVPPAVEIRKHTRLRRAWRVDVGGEVFEVEEKA